MEYAERQDDRIPANPKTAFYLQNLLNEASRRQILSDAEIEKVQMALLNLLAAKITSYTRDRSSSVRLETAETLMQSNLYTIGLYLKSLPGPMQAMQALRQTEVTELYRLGRKRLNAKISVTNHFYQMLKQNKIETKLAIYQAAVLEEIPQALRLYQPDYMAHEIPAAPDYPLAHSPLHLAGIEYLQDYVQSLYYENAFCACFSAADLQALCLANDPTYEDTVFNLFQLVYLTAIGCELSHLNFRQLRIKKVELESLAAFLLQQTEEQIILLGNDASQQVIRQLNLGDRALIQYLEDQLPALLKEIRLAAKGGALEQLFRTAEEPTKTERQVFSFGDKMEDAAYRAVLEELHSCRYLSDKLAIIREKFRSLSDLDDFILDGNLTERETLAVLQTLEPIEIAALVKRHCGSADPEAETVSEAEDPFRTVLRQFIAQQSAADRQQLTKMVNSLQIES
ncbi:MAG: DUF6179 domain-containing protein [Negativicutes bacterium]|nr:DUF6179 domain-containing protein [Negativicutes bacterium]